MPGVGCSITLARPPNLDRRLRLPFTDSRDSNNDNDELVEDSKAPPSGLRDQFYEEMADYTFRPYPRDVTPPPKHLLPRRLVELVRQNNERNTTSSRLHTPRNITSLPLRSTLVVRHQRRLPKAAVRNLLLQLPSAVHLVHNKEDTLFLRKRPQLLPPARREASSKDEDEPSSGGGSRGVETKESRVLGQADGREEPRAAGVAPSTSEGNAMVDPRATLRWAKTVRW
ncbi:unnamed protein product [Heligmosomoides polygyrus]|uniref:Uncharacterized protein n=1 Tax=Heligmosomoides polygyrus TaxID=6339 RepID=A0A183FWX3_HELPZ|nr:unnamed protein product [Heligmosomoides polygyrus]